MYHEVSTVTRLTRPGSIITSIYRAGDVQWELNVRGAHTDICTPSRLTRSRWSGNLLPVGQRVPAYIQIDADISGGGSTSLSTSAAVVVEQRSDGPRPEPGSLQITGPEGEARDPLFSADGQRLFYRRSLSDRGEICLVNASGGMPRVLVSPGPPLYPGFLWFGWFTSADGDSTIVYSLHSKAAYSRIVSLNLYSNRTDTVSTTGYLTGDLKNVPGTPSQTIYIVDLDTRQQSVLMDNVAGYTFCLAHDGRTYAVLAPDELSPIVTSQNYFLIRDGTPGHITTYPGPSSLSDLCFSPDDRSVALAATRRGDAQIWKIPL